jgi:hypothetical protein
LRDFRGHVLHVPRRQELSLLHVDRAPGFAGGDQQVRLPTQKRRDLQDIDGLRHRRALQGLMHVRQDRTTEALAQLRQDRQSLIHAHAARRVGAGAVRLVERRLVNEADAELARQLGQGLAHLARVGARFKRAWASDQRQRPIVPDGDVADSDVTRCGHRKSKVTPLI